MNKTRRYEATCNATGTFDIIRQIQLRNEKGHPIKREIAVCDPRWMPYKNVKNEDNARFLAAYASDRIS